jgi:YD repeat-containing protein
MRGCTLTTESLLLISGWSHPVVCSKGVADLTYDAENRLTGVSGGASASFVYDGDGRRMKATLNGSTTVYIGDYFEWTGSTSLTSDANGTKLAELRIGMRMSVTTC